MYDRANKDTATPLNLEKRLTIVRRVLHSHMDVLDVGCGAGAYLAAMRAFCASIRGIEPVEDKVQAASDEIRPFLGVGAAEALPFADRSFDLVLLNEVLEHVFDDHAALREIHRVLRPKGWLVLMSPNRFFPFDVHGMIWFGKDRLASQTFLLPYVPQCLHHAFHIQPRARDYWPWQLRRMVNETGFAIHHVSCIAQTVEGKGEMQVSSAKRELLRSALGIVERVPGFRWFCSVSTVIIARKL
jgi:SAM-dependent methyltransferase